MIFFAGIDLQIIPPFRPGIPPLPSYRLLLHGALPENAHRRLSPSRRPESSRKLSRLEFQSSHWFRRLFRKRTFCRNAKRTGFSSSSKIRFYLFRHCRGTRLSGRPFVILLFTLLLYRTAKTVYESADLYGALLSIGFLGMFLFQVFENIAMTMGIMPVTGVTLPFVSYGGSSVLSGMMALGLIISVGIRGRSTGL